MEIEKVTDKYGYTLDIQERSLEDRDTFIAYVHVVDLETNKNTTIFPAAIEIGHVKTGEKWFFGLFDKHRFETLEEFAVRARTAAKKLCKRKNYLSNL